VFRTIKKTLTHPDKKSIYHFGADALAWYQTGNVEIKQ
jgi:hypothetical protein